MIIELLTFVGMGLYFFSAIGFLFLFLRTLRTKDGAGLQFLKYLTLGLFISSLATFLIRVFSIYGNLNLEVSRAIAIVNPITLLAVALYLNYLFHYPQGLLKSKNSKNFAQMSKNVKIIKED